MFELRWLERSTGKKLMNEHGFFYDETVKVLQFRQQYETTFYGEIGQDGDFMKRMVWGEWKDVPTVTEVNGKQ
jgi:hypothetical protein